MDEFDVTIIEADLYNSSVSGFPVVRLMVSPYVLYFLDGRLVTRLYCHISNVHPKVGWRRAKLRIVLGMTGLDEPFTDKELISIIGRRIRVGFEVTEFQGILRLCVTDFLHYSGSVDNPDYSDNEYVFMIREVGNAK